MKSALPLALVRRSVLLACTLLSTISWLSAEPPAATSAKAPQESLVPGGERKVTEIAYVSNPHFRQRLDLYIPAEPKGPLLVWIHGGGWTGGTKDNPPGLALLGKGVTVASLEYRFSQDAIFPAQIEDCKAAIRWLRAHAADYGYNPKQIAAWGASAGGHLVALLGVTGQTRDFDIGENLDQSSAVQCVIDWFGPADFPAYDPALPNKMVQRENPDSLIAKLLGGTVMQKMDLAKKASPVTYVSKDAAPMLIMQGTDDPLVPLAQSQELYDKLKAAGADVKIEVIQGAGHGGGQFTTPERLKLMSEFLAAHWAGASF